MYCSILTTAQLGQLALSTGEDTPLGVSCTLLVREWTERSKVVVEESIDLVYVDVVER